MGNIPSKPVVVNQEWTNGVTKLNQTNLTSGVNQNITNIKTAVDGIIDALGGPGTDPGNLEEITWTNLKALRDAGQLVPGKQYRITDYECTTVTENTSSAGHPFDIIVTANDDHTLNENARAILHEGDTDYFGYQSQQIVSAEWLDGVTISDIEFKALLTEDLEVHYADDDMNETSLVITQLTKLVNQDGIEVPAMLNPDPNDSGNECYYVYVGTFELEDITYDMWQEYYPNKDKGYTNDYHLTNILVSAEIETTVKEKSKVSAWQLKYSLDNDTSRFAWADATNGKGVIYYMKDEFNNECPYDFKNILFTASEKYTNAYTFTYTKDSALYDASILANKNCYNNVIKEFYHINILQLNWNVFYSTTDNFNCYSNTFGNDCSFNTFGNYCSSNIFGNNCSSNIFGNNCSSNTFDTKCYKNTFGTSCFNNTFGNSCSFNTFATSCFNNTFGNSCESNTFGGGCDSNTFGNSCSDNTFDTNCDSNTFGNSCSDNTFDTNCQNNTFGNYCGHNAFGDKCSSNTFGDSCSSNTFGDNCIENTFGIDCDKNTFGVACRFNKIGGICEDNTFGDNCEYNILDTFNDKTTFGNNCVKNTFARNCGHNTFGDNCSFNSIDSECYSNTFGSNCSYNKLGSECKINTFGNKDALNKGCNKNILGSDCQNNTFGDNCEANTFGTGCYFNSFGSLCKFNSLADNCRSLSFGNSCNSNVFGSSCSNNSFGNSCEYNTFGSICITNTFGNECESNTFGNECSHNTFGDSCSSNNLGNNCTDNTFADYCESNTLGDNCYSNTFGEECATNIFGVRCFSNTLGYICESNTLGNDCYNNTFGEACQSNTFGNYCSYSTLGDWCQYNSFGNDCTYIVYPEKSYHNIIETGVKYVTLTATGDTSKNLQNVTIRQGVSGASSSNPLTIQVPRNLSYETEYYLDNLGNLTVSNFSTRITWSELKALRDASQLVPGKQYRITDYLTAVEQPECRSAGHPFDIIVTALTANTLSEDAKAVVRDGDDYFLSKASASWKSGITLSDIKSLYEMSDGEGSYSVPREKARVFTQMGTMVNPVTGVEVPYLFEPDPDDGGSDCRYLFVGEYKFNGVIYDQWKECEVDGTPISSGDGTEYYELTNVVVDCERNFIEKAKLSAWKLKYCLDNDYNRFGFAVRHDVIRVGNDGGTSLFLRYPSLDGDDGLAWVLLGRADNMEIEETVNYDDLVTSSVIYTTSLSVNVGDPFDMSGMSVSVLATRIGKGVIYEMEDEWGNKLPYDFKNVQFNRYKVTHSTSAYDGFDGQYVGCKDINGNTASPQEYDIIDADFKWCYTFNWYNANGESEDYSIVGNISLHNDEGFISGCYNNVFGSCMEQDHYPETETHLNRKYLGNNVIWDDYKNEDGTSYGFYSNTVGDGFYNNTVFSDFSNNFVGESFFCNTVGSYFNSNTVYNFFRHNTVGDAFYKNTVGNDFNSNTVGKSFDSNTVGTDFSRNTVGSYFNSNTVGTDFSRNTVGDFFQQNTVDSDFEYNTVGNYIYDSSIKGGVSYIALGSPSGSQSNRLQYITIGSSIYGASSKNPLVITPVRNANYEQEYVSANKVVRQV